MQMCNEKPEIEDGRPVLGKLSPILTSFVTRLNKGIST